MLAAGSAADRTGARRVFTIGLATFAAGSAACAAAPSLGVLIAARAIQGLGASALLPCSLALVVHQFPDTRARARALGVWGAMGSVGVALGPVLGGALVAAAGWRSIFVVNVPVCLITIALLRRYVGESSPHPDRRADWPGLILGALALSGITAPGSLLAVGLAAGIGFVGHERRSTHPMLPLSLFRSRDLSGATVIGLIFNLVLYGSLLCLSLFLQQQRHEPVLTTGLLLLPMSLLVGLGSLASGPLTARLGPRPPMIAGLTLAGAGAVLLATAGQETSLAPIVAGSLLLGLPLTVAAAGYLVAIGLSVVTISPHKLAKSR